MNLRRASNGACPARVPFRVTIISLASVVLVPHAAAALGVRGETPRCTETGEAPGSRGATREHAGLHVTEEQQSEAGCIAGRMQREFRHGLLGREPAVAQVRAAAHVEAVAHVEAAQVQAAELAQDREPAALETVVEVRVHGNYSVPDAEVLEMAGVAVGDVAGPGIGDAVARRLEATGRFETVEVRKRYRSLAATDRVALVIVVRERAGASHANPVLRSLGRLADWPMFLPILDYEEGYGTTYGVHTSLVDVLGADSRLSIPVTWGADKGVSFEAQKRLSGRFIDRVAAGVSRGRRRHPYYDVDDDRTRFWVGIGRGLGSRFRVSAETSREEVRFFQHADRLTRSFVRLDYGGASASLFARDDVRASAAIERVAIAGGQGVFLRPRIDAQAFKGVGGQAVLAARVLFEGASAALPPYERLLLGGEGTLRGWRVGSRVGDRLVAASVELRLPVVSPLSMGTAGLRVFYDTAAAYDAGHSLHDQRFLKGAGAGVFLVLPFGSLHVDAGHDLRGSVRLHAGAGVGF